MNILIIDNYDSFTYNLAHMVKESGAQVSVERNDKFPLSLPASFDKIILSPGPGVPALAGLLEEVIKIYQGKKPILGVCLGHQAIGEVFGGKLSNLSQVFHGVQTTASIIKEDYLFQGLSNNILVGRYHSWIVDRDGFPDCLEITAESGEGHIMALRHKHSDIHGIQFHPESILTPDGKRIIENFLNH